jgi:hypothetical protein
MATHYVRSINHQQFTDIVNADPENAAFISQDNLSMKIVRLVDGELVTIDEYYTELGIHQEYRTGVFAPPMNEQNAE